MLLLEAVNNALRGTGESPVTSTASANPAVTTILQSIAKEQRRLQRRNWWFNHARVTLPLDTATATLNRVVVDPSIELAIPWDRTLNYIPKADAANLVGGVPGRWMWNANSNSNTVGSGAGNTWVIGQTVDAHVRYNYTDFTVLPEEFAEYVSAAAALDYAASYDGDAMKLKVLQMDLSSAQMEANRANIRYAKLNLFSVGSTGVNIQRGYGQRYGRYGT